MITLWHNPRCSKSRAALELLQATGHPLTVRRYLDDPPDRAEIEAVHKALGTPPMIAMMRPTDAVFRDLGLTRDAPEDRLIAAMAAHPILIERPIALRGSRAVIGRPPSAVEALFQDAAPTDRSSAG